MTNAQLTYKVEIDVSGGAFGSAFSATDVSSKAVAGLGFEPTTVAWGRQDQHSDVTPTAVDGEMLNTDGTFSPGNSSSTYYPHIRRNLRRRVSVGVNATTVHLSEDYATSIEVVPAKDTPAVAKVTGTDVLGRFGQSTSTQDVNAQSVGTTMRSFLAEEMMLDNPSCLYMMQEDEGATSFADVTGKCSPLVVVNSKYGPGVVDAGQTAVGTFEAGTVVDVTNANYGTSTRGGSWLAGVAPSVSAFTIEVWAQAPAAVPASVAAYVVNFGGAGFLKIDQTTGKLDTGGFGPSPASVCDGKLHQFVLTCDSSNNGTLYIDGNSVATGTSAKTLGGPFTVAAYDDALGGQAYFTGAVAYVALFGSALSGARVQQHYDAGVFAFAGERTDQRITRLVGYRSGIGPLLDTGLSVMGLQNIQGRSLQDCLFEVGQVEAGVVYGDGVGRVVFRSRSRLFNPTPTVTLNMASGGVDFGSNWREDTQNVINDATVTNSTTGSAQRFFNSSSITADGEYATSTSLPVSSDSGALNLAGWTVANGTQAQLTATPLIVNLLHLTAAQAQAVLQLAPLDCLQLTNCPTPAPASTMTFMVQGGTISLAADGATATLNLSPTPYPVAVWDVTNWDDTSTTWAF